MTDITELARRVEHIISDMKLKHGDKDTYAPVMKWDEFLALVEALEKAQTINAAAEKLVHCKGRYHSEQNYRALAALFGVTTPDLPPLDSESSAVTVKLTDINEYLAEVHDKTLNRAFRLLAEGVRAGDVAAMRAAGIKVEAE
nr:hypothetical protein [Klebsiella variicola]